MRWSDFTCDHETLAASDDRPEPHPVALNPTILSQLTDDSLEASLFLSIMPYRIEKALG